MTNANGNSHYVEYTVAGNPVCCEHPRKQMSCGCAGYLRSVSSWSIISESFCTHVRLSASRMQNEHNGAMRIYCGRWPFRTHGQSMPAVYGPQYMCRKLPFHETLLSIANNIAYQSENLHNAGCLRIGAAVASGVQASTWGAARRQTGVPSLVDICTP